MSKEMTLNYCMGIVNSLETLEFLESEGITTLEELEEREEEFERAQYCSAVDLLADYQEQAEEWGNLTYAYFSDVLDIEKVFGAGGDLRRINLIVTVGGPHAEIKFDGGESARVYVFWGADKIQRTASVPIVAEHVFEMFGGE